MKNKCKHTDKSFSPNVLMSNPPQYPWICRKCGEEGVDRELVLDNDLKKLKRNLKKERNRNYLKHHLPYLKEGRR